MFQGGWPGARGRGAQDLPAGAHQGVRPEAVLPADEAAGRHRPGRAGSPGGRSGRQTPGE